VKGWLKRKPTTVGAAVGLELRLVQAAAARQRPVRLGDLDIEADPIGVLQHANEFAEVELARVHADGRGHRLVSPLQEAAVGEPVVGHDQYAYQGFMSLPPMVQLKREAANASRKNSTTRRRPPDRRAARDWNDTRKCRLNSGGAWRSDPAHDFAASVETRSPAAFRRRAG
jgi:hypothetical protein